MSSDRLIARVVARRGLTALSAAVLAATMLGAGSAQAAVARSGKSTQQVNRSGTYNGQLNQLLPKPFKGHIHFVVSRGNITKLRFTAETLCGTMTVIDKDHAVPDFPLKVKPTGAFSYKGTVAGRQIRLRGRIIGDKAQGTFFQSFTTSGLTCTMTHAAPFTATR